MSTGESISAIVISYNVADHLHECLQSIKSQQGDFLSEIIVVDNASADESPRLLRDLEASWPILRVTLNEENVGFSRGVNQGIKQATGDIILLVNPDALLPEEAFRKTADALRRHRSIGILGAVLLNEDGTLQSTGGESPGPWALFKSYLLFSSFWKSLIPIDLLGKEGIRSVDYVSGAYMAIRSSVIEDIGTLDETYFMYGEDVEYCERARDAGWQVSVLRDLQICHLHSRSTSQKFASTAPHIVLNTLRNVRRRKGDRSARISYGIIVLGFFFRSILYLPFNPSRARAYSAALRALWNTDLPRHTGDSA